MVDQDLKDPAEVAAAWLEEFITTSGTTPLDAALRALEAVAARLGSANPIAEAEGYSGPELGAASVRADRAMSRLLAKRLDWLNAEQAAGLWSLERHHRTFVQHVEHSHGMAHARAVKEVRLATQLREHLPAAHAGLRAGRFGVDKAAVLATHAPTSQKRRAALASLMLVTTEPDAAPAAASNEGEAGPEVEDANLPEAAEPEGVDGGRDAEDGAGAGTDVAPHRVVTVEAFLAEQAVVLPFKELIDLARNFAYRSDPDADDRGYTEAKAKEYVQLDKTMDGFHLSGFLAEDSGQLVKTALDAVMGVPPAGDTRSAGQRRAQALTDLAQLALDNGAIGTGKTIRPHLAVHVPYNDFTRLLSRASGSATCCASGGSGGGCSGGVSGGDGAGSRDSSVGCRGTGCREGSCSASGGSVGADETLTDWQHLLSQPMPTWADGTGPVPTAVLRRLACVGEIQRIIFGPDSEILDMGRKYRYFTANQRRALIARDKHCTYPDCTAPPEFTEAHHARTDWAQGGPTNITNGALLCWHHHRIVTQHHITMTREPSDRGAPSNDTATATATASESSARWRFHQTNGQEIIPHYRT